tara:strand:+ start:881 stop:1606 length:726 start_codon:yes stop_codon:yes gene_type:complete
MAWWTQGSGIGSLIPNKKYEYSIEFYFGNNSNILFNATTVTMPKLSAEVIQDSAFGKKHYDVGNVSWEPITITVPDFYHNNHKQTTVAGETKSLPDGFSEGFRLWLMAVGMLKGKWTTNNEIQSSYEDALMGVPSGTDYLKKSNEGYGLNSFSYSSADINIPATDDTEAFSVKKGIANGAINKILIKKFHGDIEYNWIVHNPILSSLGFGEMSYASEEISTIEIMFQYETAYYVTSGMKMV